MRWDRSSAAWCSDSEIGYDPLDEHPKLAYECRLASPTGSDRSWTHDIPGQVAWRVILRQWLHSGPPELASGLNYAISGV
jgi:hypothetical protein